MREWSSLVDVINVSPNNSGKRTDDVTRITPHCFVGQVTAERGLEVFKPSSRQASCNYVIGLDGRIGGCVPETNRSWCTGGLGKDGKPIYVAGISGSMNDQKAITIECASDANSPYAFKDACYNSLINLCVDICQAYGKKKLLWIEDKVKANEYKPKADEMILTVHRWYALKSCPGDWMYARMGDLATQVTKRLGSPTPQPTPQPTPTPAAPTVNITVPELKKGDNGRSVKKLQQLLMGEGYSLKPYNDDGSFGGLTENAVKQYQKKKGLKQDGIVGKATWESLLN